MLDVAARSRTLLPRLPLLLGLSLGAPLAASAAPLSPTLAMQVPPMDAPPADPAAPPAEPPPPPPPPAPPGGLKIEGNGATLKLGFLVQPGFEYTSQSFSQTSTAIDSFFLRRLRLMAGLTLGSTLEFFFETDTPNLGKDSGGAPAATGVLATSLARVQDAFITWKPMDEFKLDGGMMLIPFTHNSVQGATTLYGWDYFASSFLQSGGYGNFAGRDVGAQARGLVIGKLEYRLGVFTGKRDAVAAPMMAPPSKTILRLAGRVQVNMFDPEAAYFYAGTYGGAKKILSFGAGFDHQDTYTGFAVDGFLDWPVGPDVVTAQFAFLHYNGGTWMGIPTLTSPVTNPMLMPPAPIPAAKKVTAIVAEAGYRIAMFKLSPIVRFENQSASSDAVMDPMVVQSPSVLRFSAGLAWWAMGHTANVKAFYTYVKPDNSFFETFNQFNLQVQFYVF